MTSVTVRDTAATIQEFFTRFGAGDVPGMVELFASPVDFAVAGAEDVVPWTGSRTDHLSVAEFLRIATEDITTEKFDITKTMVDGADGVVLGAFAHRITRTGKLFESTFALHIQVTEGLITKYHMFEDSHGAAQAWS